ncbi:10289_t:CDS:1, partial [Gigaspora rosea]
INNVEDQENLDNTIELLESDKENLEMFESAVHTILILIRNNLN